MNTLVVVSEVCSRCGRSLPDGSGFCSHCDSPPVSKAVLLGSNCGQPIPADRPPTVGLACLDNRWMVVGLLLVAGPAGLPFLWFSRRFSKSVKILTSVAYAVLTVAVPLGLVWYWCEVSVRPLVNALAK